MTVKVKKITKYSKYFLFFAVASLVSWALAEKSRGGISDASPGMVIPVVYADHPSDSPGDAGAGADCDSDGGDCD